MSRYSGEFIAVRDADELRKLMKECSAEGTGIIPTGRTSMPPLIHDEEENCIVSLAEMDSVIAYAADDLTITVEAGALLDDVRRIVHEGGQRLCVEAAPDPGLTIGALVSCGRNGFISSALGTVADQVLGVHAISGDGRRLVGGGRVVKNVTGYDFVRLLTGSAGTLGIITEVTLRLRPLPPAETSFVLSFGSPQEAHAAAGALRQARHVITALVLVDGTAVHADQRGPLLMVRGEGSPASLIGLTRLVAELGSTCDRLDADEGDALWREVGGFAHAQSFHLAMRMPPSRAEQAIAMLSEQATGRPFGVVADLQRAALSFTLDDARPADEVLKTLDVRAVEKACGAAAALPDNTLDVERRWMRFTPPDDNARKIADRIKIAFDPAGILMPMRPVAGSF